jgi:hypothetical protein
MRFYDFGGNTSRKVIVAILLVFMLWAIIDLIIHGLILSTHYSLAGSVFRPEHESMMVLVYVARLAEATALVLLFALFVGRGGIAFGAGFGGLLGFGMGMTVGYGGYALMPIPYALALGWFLTLLGEYVVAGVILGAMFKGAPAALQPARSFTDQTG